MRQVNDAPFDLAVLKAVDSPEGLAAQLRALRELDANRLALKQLENRTGASKATLSNWFRGKTAPSTSLTNRRVVPEVAYDALVALLAERAGFSAAEQAEVRRAFGEAVERVAGRRTARRRQYVPRWPGIRRRRPGAELIHRRDGPIVVRAERIDVPSAISAVPPVGEALGSPRELMDVRAPSVTRTRRRTASAELMRTRARRWALRAGIGLSMVTVGVVIGSQIVDHRNDLPPDAESTSPFPTGHPAGDPSTAMTTSPSASTLPESGNCPDSETPWTGREPAVQDRGSRTYAVRRDGTSAVFEVRDRQARVLERYSLGGNIMGSPVLGRGSQPDADVWVFAVDAITNDLVYKRARADATNWDTEWGVVEGELTSDVAATSHQAWGIEVFVRGAQRANGEKTVDHATYTFATGRWVQWYYFDGSVTSAPELADHLDGRMTVTTCGTDRNYIRYDRQPDGTWTGWHPVGS